LASNDFSRLNQLQQQQLVKWFDTLDEAAKQSLRSQIEAIDFELLDQLFVQSQGEIPLGESPAQKAERAAPAARLFRVPGTPEEQSAWDEAADAGNAALRAGKVGVILVAGGQGTRLGFPHPKGMFPIGPVSGKSLFQLLAEEVVARSRRAGAALPYYVMTSDATHDETVAYFQEHAHFGLDPHDVHFFRQGNMPAVDRKTGRVLLADKHEVSTSPDGHGGLLAALDRAKLLDDMAQRKIEYLYYHQVDNPLARVCDPAFLGFHVQEKSEATTKVVAKLSAEEKMGVVVDVDGRTQIIEYSDFPPAVAARRDGNGELTFWAGSTAIHIFSRALFDRLIDEKIELPFHTTVKKVPYLDDKGNKVRPETENALKFERFIFDVLPLASHPLVVEARRDDEFCPLKNAEGDFSPEFVKGGLSRLHAGWLTQAGVDVPAGTRVEISPLYALDAAELKEKVDPSLQITGPLYLADAS
jgi:UDP-N-acetylglucosamine/UDP-N-acetylgalactosamine diphosphorylase